MRPALVVIHPGLHTTVQDLGRIGFQRQGVPVSGVLDPVSLRAANVLVGNAEGTAGLEMLYQGATLEVSADSVRVALAGLGVELELTRPAGEEGAATPPIRMPAFRSVRLERGTRLRAIITGASIGATLAIEGGIDLPAVMGSLSTLPRAGIGGFEGRLLKAGDAVPLKSTAAAQRDEMELPPPELKPPGRYRVVLGPQDDFFTAKALATFLSATYTLMPASDRMGLRLDGPKLEHAKGYNIVSDGIAPGAVQVPGLGLPIILMADRQTTGGYPKIAAVISADLPALGRLGPGAKVTFEAVPVETAERIRRDFEAALAGHLARAQPVRDAGAIDPERLAAANLVSGVVDARE